MHEQVVEVPFIDETARMLVEDYERKALLRSPEAAQNRYRRGVERLIQLIWRGFTSKSDVVWKNTCELLINGRLRLFVLSPRHDSRQIVKNATGNPDAPFRIYFGGDSAVSLESETSPAPVPNYDQTVMREEEEEGRANPGEITIIDPWRFSQRDESALQQKLIHEVQHAVSHRSTSDADHYREEFTAYWVSGAKGDESKEPLVLKDGTKINGLDNPRQFAIFKHLYRNSTTVSREMNSKASATLHRLLGKKPFWEIVQEFKAPSGINLINSMRIDDLYCVVVAKQPNRDAVMEARRALKPEDETALRGPGMAQPWRDLIDQSKLPPAERTELKRGLGL